MQEKLKSEGFRRTLIMVATAIVGIMMLAPLQHCQPKLSQGDHGLNLYAAMAVMRGGILYHDFHWFYGPLMPYYYALFLKVFGLHISSVLLGRVVLHFLSGMAFWAILSRRVTPVLAGIATLWYWQFIPDAFYTYNHAGGVALSMFALAALYGVLRTGRRVYLYGGWVFLFLLSLVKLNIGLANLLAFAGCLLGYDILVRKVDSLSRRQVIAGTLAVGGLVVLVHVLLLAGLSSEALRQCFQYFQNDAFQEQYRSPLAHISIFVKMVTRNIGHSRLSIGICLLVVAMSGRLLKVAWERASRSSVWPDLVMNIGIPAVFFVVNFHEFLISGIYYRLIWVESFKFVMMFGLIGLGIRGLSPLIRYTLLLALAVVVAIPIRSNMQAIQRVTTNTAHYFDHPRAEVFILNHPHWRQTVTETVAYLDEHAGSEPFLAVPYDPLLYFLRNQLSPTRQLAFFEWLDITPAQQQRIIAELEQQDVRWVVMSSRIVSTEPGLGRFGETHCRLLARYIEENFIPVAEFGRWDLPAGWTYPYATRIFQRRENRQDENNRVPERAHDDGKVDDAL